MAKPASEGWVTYGFMVLGGLGSLVAIATIFTKELVTLLAFIAGTGWVLAIPLLVIIKKNSATIEDLRTDLKAVREAKDVECSDLRQQISEWRTIATQDSESLNRFVSRAVEIPAVQPRRAPVAVPAVVAVEEDFE